MKKYTFVCLISLLFLANFSRAAEKEEKEEKEETETCYKRVTAVWGSISSAAEALDGTWAQDPSSSLFLNTTHFLSTLGGAYQVLRPYMDDNTAALTAFVVSSGRMLWFYDRPASSIPGTAGAVILAWLVNS